MAGQLSTVRDLRRVNRSTLLTELFSDGPCSRQELAQRTSLSQATVSNVIGELIADGVVVEAGAVDSNGGRPRIQLRVRPEHAHVIGIDVGESRVRVELFDLAMTVQARAEYPLRPDRPDVDEIVAHIIEGIGEMRTAVEPGTDILGVGIGVSGIIERGPRLLVHSQAAGWDAVPLAELIGAEVSLPLHIDNGAKTMGLAEMWFGAGRGARDAVVALLGSGVGASVVARGSTYRGSTGSAGEWGHTIVEVGGRRCRCGARGCLEAYLGAGAILERYRALRRGRTGAEPVDEETAFAELLAAGTATATRVLDEAIRYLGAGIGNLINLLNPERIVIGGWAGLMLGERLLPRIRATAAEHALRRPFAQTSITVARLGQDAVALGAATLPIERFLLDGGVRDQRNVRPA